MLREIYQKLVKDDYLAKSVILTLRDDDFNTISRRKTLNDYSIDLLESEHLERWWVGISLLLILTL